MYIAENTNSKWEIVCASWGEMVDVAETGTSELKKAARNSRSAKGPSDMRFFGTGNFEDALFLAREGWPAGVARVRARMDVLQANVPGRRLRKELVMARLGPGTLHLGRYVSGHPAPWITWQETGEEIDGTSASGRVVHVVCNLSASCAIGQEELFDKGALVCMLVDLLERSGRRVELSTVLGAKDYGEKHVICARTLIKEAHDPLDLERIVFSVAHASSFRRLGFSLMEQAPEPIRRHVGVPNGGYGSPVRLTVPNAINIDETYSGVHNSEVARVEWLRKRLEEQGVTWEDVDE